MSVIDDFLTNVPEPQKAELERVRQIILKTVPEPQETIAYGMPVIKYRGKYVIGFSPFKDHLSVFPGAEAIEALQSELTDYKTATGTVQFSVNFPLPESVIKAMVEIRLQAISATDK